MRRRRRNSFRRTRDDESLSRVTVQARYKSTTGQVSINYYRFSQQRGRINIAARHDSIPSWQNVSYFSKQRSFYNRDNEIPKLSVIGTSIGGGHGRGRQLRTCKLRILRAVQCQYRIARIPTTIRRRNQNFQRRAPQFSSINTAIHRYRGIIEGVANYTM